jgi:hypothetical protein
LVNVSEPDLEALECWIFRGAKTKSQQSEELRGLTIIPADSVC